MSSRVQRVGVLYRDHLWPTVTLFALLAVTATLTSSPGAYAGDNRFEQYWNPARRVARSMTIWDAFRGLGRVREDFWPGTTVPIAVFRAIGADPVLAERLWHALLLTLIGVGVVEIMRLFRPRRGAEHLLAGLAAAFGAYSASFLTPFSNLYFQFVVGVWLVVFFTHGLRSQRPWRWAAAVALAVFLPGDVDTPGLVYNMIPLIWVSVYLLLVDRSVRLRHYTAFLARCGVLTLGLNAAVLVKVYLGAATFGQRLNDTETAEVSFLTSSWPESIRGLGNWLSYFRDDGQLLKPQSAGYFSSWVIVTATFIPVVFALTVPWLSRWRPRILFSMMALGSLVVLVGAYPLYEPSPLGEQVYKAFANIPALTAFRNTYKIGSGLVIGISVMFGYGVMATYRRVRRLDRHLAYVPVALGCLGLLGAGFPFWTGNVYNPDQTASEVPGYWSDATQWLDAQPGSGRVLIVPPTSRSRYRWGWVGDDIFDALLTRPHAVATGVPLTTPEAANLLEAISFGASDRNYVTGTLAPIAARLGFEYVIVRNDLDWQELGRPRPAAYSRLRADPDLELVAAFGRPGENTTAADDTSAPADEERALPPVEVYRINESDGAPVRLGSDDPSLLVSGDGWAYAPLVEAGLLPSGGPPTEYTARLTPTELAERLDGGSGLVVTDTNRRRLRVMLSYEPDYSHTLAAGEELDRAPRPLFDDPDAESVAWYPDAEVERLTGPSRSVNGSKPWNRPSNAFDGDPRTQVLLRRADGPVGRTFRVDLRGARNVSSVRVDVANVIAANDGIVGAELRFSDGSVVPVDLTGGPVDGPFPVRVQDVQFPARTTEWIELRITRIAGTAKQFGIADITVPGLDLAEYIDVPDDVVAATSEDAALVDALHRAPITYLFTTWAGYGEQPEETALRRRFTVAQDDPYELTGTLRYGRDVNDELVDALLARPVGATSQRRADGAPDHAATFAVDGDPTTGWSASARVGEQLTMRFPNQEVSSVAVVASADQTVPVRRFEAILGGERHDLVPERVTPCPGGEAGSTCWVARASFEPVPADHLDLRVAELDNPGAGLGGGRVQVGEIEVNSVPNEGLPTAESALEGCHDIGLRVTRAGGLEMAVPVEATGTVGALLGGEALSFRACNGIDLDAGVHLLDSGPATGIERVALTTASRPLRVTGSPAPGEVSAVAESPTRITVEGRVDEPAVMILEQGWAKGWAMEGPADAGLAAGQSTMFDTLNGWRLQDPGPLEVDLRYRGQLLFGASLVITLGTLIVCVLIFALPSQAQWRRRRRAAPEEAT